MCRHAVTQRPISYVVQCDGKILCLWSHQIFHNWSVFVHNFPANTNIPWQESFPQLLNTQKLGLPLKFLYFANLYTLDAHDRGICSLNVRLGVVYMGSRGLWCTNFGFGAQIFIQSCFGGHFSHRLSLLLNIQIEESDNFDPQFLKLAPPLL